MKTVSEAADRPLLSVNEAAKIAGLSKSLAYRLAAAGRLPGLVRLPGVRMLVRRRVLEAWLEGTAEANVGAVPNDAVMSLKRTPPEHGAF